jgi:hypothetical protein
LVSERFHVVVIEVYLWLLGRCILRHQWLSYLRSISIVTPVGDFNRLVTFPTHFLFESLILHIFHCTLAKTLIILQRFFILFCEGRCILIIFGPIGKVITVRCCRMSGHVTHEIVEVIFFIFILLGLPQIDAVDWGYTFLLRAFRYLLYFRF